MNIPQEQLNKIKAAVNGTIGFSPADPNIQDRSKRYEVGAILFQSEMVATTPEEALRFLGYRKTFRAKRRIDPSHYIIEPYPVSRALRLLSQSNLVVTEKVYRELGRILAMFFDGWGGEWGQRIAARFPSLNRYPGLSRMDVHPACRSFLGEVLDALKE